MPSLNIAHVNRGGVDLIILPLDQSFDRKTEHDKAASIADFQARCTGIGLKGTVVPVWPVGIRMAFIAPVRWRPFFASINLWWVLANVNRSVSW